MTAEERARLREIALRATPGPWSDREDAEIGYTPSYIQTEDRASTIAIMYGGGPKISIDKAQERRNAAHIAAFDPPTVLSLIDALDAAEARADAIDEHYKFQGQHLAAAHVARAAKELSDEWVRCWDGPVVIARREQARVAILSALRAERAKLEKALEAVLNWANKRCPCDNDEPKICPLCSADVATDRCMAVDVSFPRTLRARIAAELGEG